MNGKTDQPAEAESVQAEPLSQLLSRTEMAEISLRTMVAFLEEDLDGANPPLFQQPLSDKDAKAVGNIAEASTIPYAKALQFMQQITAAILERRKLKAQPAEKPSDTVHVPSVAAEAASEFSQWGIS